MVYVKFRPKTAHLGDLLTAHLPSGQTDPKHCEKNNSTTQEKTGLEGVSPF